jgi:hypothetical protein
MAITLLQENSFMFDEQAVINKFNIKNRLGIDCVLECIDKKILLFDKLQHHILFLKGRTGSGKSTCMPSRLFKHLDMNKNEKPKVIINVVEPRVLLAQSISQDNCDNEPYLKSGINTGYYTGAGKTDIKGPSKLVYMTTDLFRMKLNKGIGLGDVVIIDECHILDRPTITTLHEIKKYIFDNTIPITRKPLFIFASATLNLDLMVNYFFKDSKIKINDIYQDALMINHITGLRNFDVQEEYINEDLEVKFRNNEQEFVKYIMTEGIEKSINSKEKWKELPARDILIFSYGMGFNKLFEDSQNRNYNRNRNGNEKWNKNKYYKDLNIENENLNNEFNLIEYNLNKISDELDKYLKYEHENNIDNEIDDKYINEDINKLEYENNIDNEIENMDEDINKLEHKNKNVLNEEYDEINEIEDNKDNENEIEDNKDNKDNENDEIDENENNKDNEIDENDENEFNLLGSNIQSLCKYPVYVSTMRFDDSEQVKKWRQNNKGKFRVLILPYGTACKGFASKLLTMAYDPDYDSQQFEIKIYISTDAIETGKTVNTWYQIYDTGLRQSKIINPLLFNPNIRQSLTRHPITQSASIQRCGRVGRKCPGISIRVFTKETWNKMSIDSLPDNINLVSIAQLNLECKKDEDKIADLVKYNDYIQPNSFDTNLITGSDLVCSGYTTPWGEYINDVRDFREPATPWVLKAEELYYLNNSNLFDTLVLCRNSRQNISDLLSAERFERKPIFDENNKNVNMENIDNATIIAIYEARQEYVKFLASESVS